MYLRPWLLIAILALIPIPSPQAQQQFDFDSLAQQIAPPFQKSAAGSSTPFIVLVLDFEQRDGPDNELGRELADEFAASLRKYAQGFVVLRPAELHQIIADHNLPESTVAWPEIMKCLAPKLEFSNIIEGTMEYGGDGVVLKIHTWLSKNGDSSFGKTVIVPWTSQIRQLMAKLLPERPPFFTEEKRVWINPDHPPVSDSELVDLKTAGPGYSYPACISCGRPEFPDEAVKLKLQGTIILRVQILPDGSISKISLVRGLPCGLTDKAFEAAEQYRLKPARGPDGAPIAVEAPIEITFRLF